MGTIAWLKLRKLFETFDVKTLLTFERDLINSICNLNQNYFLIASKVCLSVRFHVQHPIMYR